MANTPVDLDLRSVPGQAGQDLELRVSGVPEDANLTAGTKISPTSWSLKPAEAAIVKPRFETVHDVRARRVFAWMILVVVAAVIAIAIGAS